jgi:hypothetical protein
MEKECARCGKTFQSKRHTKKFCSETCKQYAYLIRHGLNVQRLQAPIINNVNNAISITDNNPTVKPQIKIEEKITLEQPRIIKLIESNLFEQPNIEGLIASPGSHWNDDDAMMIKWMNMRVKCILHNLIKLSYKQKVFSETLLALSEALNRLVNSIPFRLVPENYPYKYFLKILADKMAGVFEESKNYGEIKFPLSLKKKAEFITILYNLSNLTPLRKFSELEFE